MARPRNRIALGIPGYGFVHFKWFTGWLKFQAELARNQPKCGVFPVEIPYLDSALNCIVEQAFKHSIGEYEFDYVMILEHDNLPPEGWVERVATQYDPDVHKVVGCLYFGRAQEDMRPIPGFIAEDGTLNRLSYDQVKEMTGKPGLWKVDTVGMGATVIHRSVFEDWPLKERADGVRTGWFHNRVDDRGTLGHDVNFCMMAAEQGHTIWCDSAMGAGHLGTWVSNLDTYLATTENTMKLVEQEKNRPRELTVLEGLA